ncbi:SCO6880 family protein [Microtetraspora malaysiensis]|uniref:SCO6880 family protein n=1 Tax=Microtetraspora malaysiensis TaxID=161358 RepID=UPI003D8A9912
MARVVRCAFDPAARADAVRAEDLTWADAGPIGAEEHMDHYRHDSGVSVSWAWHEAPRQKVPADVLSRLVAPGPFPKRVSVQYRPLPAAEATRVLEDEVNAAAFREHYRRRTGRDETARDAFDQARARQAAAEEATGAGVTLVTLYVTTTVTDLNDLPRAVAATAHSASRTHPKWLASTRIPSSGPATRRPCRPCPDTRSQWTSRHGISPDQQAGKRPEIAARRPGASAPGLFACWAPPFFARIPLERPAPWALAAPAGDGYRVTTAGSGRRG